MRATDYKQKSFCFFQRVTNYWFGMEQIKCNVFQRFENVTKDNGLRFCVCVFFLKKKWCNERFLRRMGCR